MSFTLQWRILRTGGGALLSPRTCRRTLFLARRTRRRTRLLLLPLRRSRPRGEQQGKGRAEAEANWSKRVHLVRCG
jgi:hypothetical protein